MTNFHAPRNASHIIDKKDREQAKLCADPEFRQLPTALRKVPLSILMDYFRNLGLL